MRAAMIEKTTGMIENIIELPDDYDPEEEGAYLPPSGRKIEPDPQTKAEVGGKFVNGVWEKAPVPVPVVVPVKATVQEQIDVLTALLVTKGTITPAQATQIKGPPAK